MAALENVNPEQFAHQLRGDADRFRMYNGKYLLEDDGNQVIAYRARLDRLVAPGHGGVQWPENPEPGRSYSSADLPSLPEPRRVGYINWYGGEVRKDTSGTPEPGINGGTVHKAYVSSQHRRKGVASAMLDFARERHPEKEIRHSPRYSQTDDGANWAQAKP